MGLVGDPSFLTLNEILELHADQIRRFGGAPGIRDFGALESGVAMPSATFGGAYLHVDMFEMAAAYAFHIAENQPFLDGNKRARLNAALVFLDINGWVVTDPEMLLYDAMIGLSSGEVNKQQLARLFETLAVFEETTI